MRITEPRQHLRGLAHHEEDAAAELLEDLERLKWLLWHGNRVRACEVLAGLLMDVDAVGAGSPHPRRLKPAVGEMVAYIRKNSRSLIDSGEHHRAGERISSAFVEAAVNAATVPRFAETQRMQGTPHSAHLPLQTRTRTLDGTLRKTFERWHPGLAADDGTRARSRPGSTTAPHLLTLPGLSPARGEPPRFANDVVASTFEAGPDLTGSVTAPKAAR